MAGMVAAELAKAFAALPTANIGDAQDRLGVATAIQAAWAGARVSGPAFTVWTRPGDNLFVHKALEEAKPGDVIVINGGSDRSRALLGDLIGERAKQLGIAGFVIDGAVRDAEGLAEIGMPVFAIAVSPAGPYKHGPGRLQVPVAIGGVVVCPGDIVVGDADGLVVVPQGDAEATLSLTREIEASEAARRTAILKNASVSLLS